MPKIYFKQSETYTIPCVSDFSPSQLIQSASDGPLQVKHVLEQFRHSFLSLFL